MTLAWGRRYLMCPSEHFGVLYEINPWMHREIPADPERSREQWDGLVAVLRQAGAEVETMPPARGLPDLVFTANAGLPVGSRFVVSRFRHPERAGEADHDEAWFRERGWEVHRLDPGPKFEGAGDALPWRDRFLAGYHIRSDFQAHVMLSELLGTEFVPLELVDPRFYHLDLTFCPLDERRAIVVPDAWDRYGREVVRNLVPEPLALSLEEGLTFCANSVVVGTTVVMPSCPLRVGRQLQAWGFEVVECAVDEFLKAGGGVRCLTLPLDVPAG